MAEHGAFGNEGYCRCGRYMRPGSECIDDIKEQLAAAQAEIAALKGKLESERYVHEFCDATVTSLSATIAALKADIADLLPMADADAGTITNLNREIAARDERVVILIGQLEQHRARVRELEIEFEDHNGCADELADALRCAEARVRELEAFISDRAYFNDHNGLDRCVECQHVYGHDSKCSIGAVLVSAATEPVPDSREAVVARTTLMVIEAARAVVRDDMRTWQTPRMTPPPIHAVGRLRSALDALAAAAPTSPPRGGDAAGGG